MTALDPRALRDAFGRFMTGVTVVTTRDAQGAPVGFTANSFTSVSLDPPLLLVCPGRFLSSFEAFAACSHFAVSILAEGQEEVSNTFAGFKGDRFARVPHVFDAEGCAHVKEAVATFSCVAHNKVDAGDHMILLGAVTGFEATDRAPLGYKRGQYFSLGLERAAQTGHGLKKICGALLQSGDAVVLEATPQGYRPPQTDLPAQRDLAKTLSDALSAQHMPARIGPVYSVFDDQAAGHHYAYLLAYATAELRLSITTRLEAVPISRLPELRYASPAIATMMHRFAQEAQTRDFTLYLGDAEAGDTHSLSPR
jgi:flavin reductase (DIM6/NTAB) family NADH-FMN oxidoreductase RutF